MVEHLRHWLRLWIAGLADAFADALDALRPPAHIAVRRDAPGHWILSEAGLPGSLKTDPRADTAAVGRLDTRRAAPGIEPDTLRQRLAGAEIRVDIPVDWVLRRALDPVPAKTTAYLDAFIRHQLERVTPWRIGTAHFATVTDRVVGEPTKISVEIVAIPHHLTEEVIAPLVAAGPRRVTLAAPCTGSGTPVAIEVPLAKGFERRRVRIRLGIAAFLSALVLGTVTSLAAAGWYQAAIEERTGDLDRAIAAQRAALGASARPAQSGALASVPETLRASQTPVVAVLDTLSAILPDHAYLTDLHLEGGRLRITGLSRDGAELIPLIERSGRFSEVSFFAPTVRQPHQGRDRFHIEMRVRPWFGGGP